MTSPEQALADDLVERVEDLLRHVPPATTSVAEFRGAQFDRGLAWVHHAPGHGGLGWDRSRQALIDERLLAAGAEDQFYHNGVGLNLVAPALAAHGTSEQRARYLRALFVGDEIWCQLFSEPGAGSDLAGLATSAVRAGSGWRINGQKVWTTLAHRADFGLLLARSDPDVPKHQGLSAFIVDMHGPGIEVRGIREMTGEFEFNEVFLTDVDVPDENRVGSPGDGWPVAMTMLSAERVAHFGDVVPRGTGPISSAMELWRDGTGRDPHRLDEVMRVWCEAEATRLANMRAAERSGSSPGAEGSIAKLSFAVANQRIYSLCMSLLESAALRYDGGFPAVRRTDMSTMTGSDVRKMYLRSFALSIEGGTSEIMRNIIGERVLGLPREPRADKDQPWRSIRRS